MFIWDFVLGDIMDQFIDWVYAQLVGFFGNFFSQMGNMGVELFEMSWVPVQCLDLTPGVGNLLGQSYWEINSHWLGELWTLNTGVSPSAAKESSLSQILQGEVPHKYYLSRTACLGILRRAKARGKELPPQLKRALEIQAEAGQKE